MRMTRPGIAALLFVAAACLSLGLLAEEPKPLVNDPMFEKQKALFDQLEVAKAWELTRGSPDVPVGVVDLGFDFYHPDLKGRLAPGFYASGGYHSEIIEISAHGTLVAGLIVAEPDNGKGMAGLAPGCRALTASLGILDHVLMRLQKRYMAENPGAGMAGFRRFMMDHAAEVQEFGKRHVAHVAAGTAEGVRFLADRGARVINLSLYLDKAIIKSEEDRAKLDGAFAYAKEKDIVLLVGSGNNGRQSEDYPGDESFVLVVGACLLDGRRWEEEVDMGGMKLKQGSNFGKRLSVVAPTDALVVCMPHDKRFYACEDGPMGETKGQFEGICTVERNGATSSATPIVASLVALVRSLRPDLKAAQVIDCVKQGCDDLGEPGFDVYTGWGRVNFRKTLEIAKGLETK
jgi:thermitase